MRWPIRNQILMPIVLIQTITLLAVAVTSAWYAVEQVERDIERRLDNVLSTLEASTYPLTSNILDQLKRLTGAEFVVYDSRGILQSTFSRQVDVRELAGAKTNSADPTRSILDDQSIVTIEGLHYFAGSVSRPLRGNSATGTGIMVLFPESSWQEARFRAILPPVIVGAACLLLTIAASVWVAGRAAIRIQSLQQHVSRIAYGEFRSLPVSHINDELRDLTVDINHMSEMLEKLMRGIRDSERIAMLSQLVGGLAHQLRNALTGARISVQLHQRHCTNSNDESIRVALQQLTLTERQIKALLRLAVGEAQPVVSTSVVSVLDETAALVKPICSHQKIEFLYHRDNVDAMFNDADAMRAALLNLAMNAIEAVGPSGRVGLSLHLNGADAVIEVTDSGPGVPDSIVGDIFNPFFTTKPEGAGLGLALARRAVEDCCGSLKYDRCDSESVFTIRLPGLLSVPGTDGQGSLIRRSSLPEI